jgi:hypothetical protein
MKQLSASPFRRALLSLMLSSALLILSLLVTALVHGDILPDPDISKLPVVDRIQVASVFENPIFFVGDVAPHPVESRALGSAIGFMSEFRTGRKPHGDYRSRPRIAK